MITKNNAALPAALTADDSAALQPQKMAFLKADIENEKAELDQLIAENPDAKRAYAEFQARIALLQSGQPTQPAADTGIDNMSVDRYNIDEGR